MKQIFLSFILLAFLSCSVNAQIEDVIEISNLSYLQGSEQELDSLQMLNLVIPKNMDNGPLLIWIGGGAWSYVNRHMEMDLARKLGQQGIAVASVGHRLSPAIWRDPSLNQGVQHPKHVEDVAAAIKWLYDHASEYAYDRNQFYIGGFSSGAQLAALVSLDSSYLAGKGLSLNIIKGVIPISGAYDLVNYYEVFLNGSRPELANSHVMAVFGKTQADLIHASPTSYLDHLSPPMLILSDNNAYNYARIFEDRIRATGFRAIQVVYAHNISHGDLWRNISYDEDSIYRALMLDFIRTQAARQLTE